MRNIDGVDNAPSPVSGRRQPTNGEAVMMTRDEVKNGIAVALGAPTIDPRLSDGVLTKILDMAANAPVATECGALESAVGDRKSVV